MFERIFTWLFGRQNQETFGIACLTAALGIFSGYALFLLWWEESGNKESGLTFVWALLAAAAMSFAFEYLRGVIEGSTHPWTSSRVLTTIIMLAAFELFIISIHDSAELHFSDFVTVAGFIFGKQFGEQVGPSKSLIALGGLWFWVALIIVFKLRRFITNWPYTKSNPQPAVSLRQYVSEMRYDLWRGAKVGLWIGAWWAPASAIAYVVVLRIYFLLVNFHNNQSAAQHLLDSSHLQGWLYGLLYGTTMFASWVAQYLGSFGAILAILAVTLVAYVLAPKESRAIAPIFPALSFVIVCCVPIFASRSALGDVAYLYLMSAVIWGIPATVLGLLAPLLRRPAHQPSVWGLLACVAAGVMMLVTVVRFNTGADVGEKLLLIGGTLLPLVLALALFRGAWTDEFWLCVALSIGLLVWGTTGLMQNVSLLAMQDTVESLISVPLAPLSGSIDEAFPDLEPASNEVTFGPDLVNDTTDLLPQGVDPIAFLNDGCSVLQTFTPDQEAAYEQSLQGAVADDDTHTSAANSLAGGLSTARSRYEQAVAAKLTKVEETLSGGPGANLQDLRTRDGTLNALDDRILTMMKNPLVPHETSFSRYNQPAKCLNDPNVFLENLLQSLSDADKRRDAADKEVMGELATDRSQLQVDVKTVEDERAYLQKDADGIQLAQAQHLELTMTSSLGFWLTIGLLAIWQLTHPDSD